MWYVEAFQPTKIYSGYMNKTLKADISTVIGRYIVDKNGIEGAYEMNTLDTIYAVFEDRHISYNKEKFIETYFKKGKPMYDEIKGR